MSGEKHVVGVADMKVAKRPGDSIITYALGSCLGITLYDPVAKVGGLLHIMLPLSTIDSQKAAQNPFMFVDTGVPKLFLSCYQAGAQKQRCIVKVAGGASTKSQGGEDHFQIGKRNIMMLKKLLWKNSVMLKAQEVGGTVSRTMTLDIDTGEVTLQTGGVKSDL